MNLFTSQQRGQVPVAPVWSQQTAANWEPSVTTVGNLGGHTIDELLQFIETKWPFLFKIQKVWRARDAISDNRYQVQSYLEHHWLILKLVPCYTISSEAEDQDDGSPNVASAINLILEAGGGDAGSDSPALQSKRGALDLESPRAKRVAAETPAESSADRPIESDTGAMGGDSTILDSDLPGPSLTSKAEEGDGVRAGLTTGAGLSAEQENLLKPREDLKVVHQGRTWFLRIDRFNEGDKWFACTTFENALLSEQAREKHYSPKSEATFEAIKGRPPLYLECLVPTLRRLATVPYSVFAKGNHCQWHARVVTTLCATLCRFIDPEGVREEFAHKVSAILIDGKEQQKYTTVKKKQEHSSKAQDQTSGPELQRSPDAKPPEEDLGLHYPKAYLLSFPEAPYLKPAILDVKELARQHPDKIPPVAGKKFPDMQLIYAAICS